MLKKYSIPFFSNSVHAGFPSPADDFIERSLDLNELMVKRPAATFFVKVRGDSMQGCGISSGDILVVDRSLNAYDNAIIIAFLDNEFTVKRFIKRKDRMSLMPANPKYKPILISQDSDFQVWGVVTFVIKTVNDQKTGDCLG